MNSKASLYFLYLYPFLLWKLAIISHVLNSWQSAHESNPFGMQQTFTLHFALEISLAPF